jgi:hypothetical protein
MINDFAATFDSQEARRRINQSELSNKEKDYYKKFIDNFSELEFYSNTRLAMERVEHKLGAHFPENIKDFRELVAGVLYGIRNKYRLKSFMRSTPRIDELNELWYTVSMLSYSFGEDDIKILLKSTPEFALVPIATVSGHENASAYFLGVNAISNDKTIYDFNILDIHDTYSEGEPIIQSAYDVFESYPHMLSCVSEICYLNNDQEIIVRAHNPD